ncbi:protein kinase, partial [bacterium]|nr:protein kinase [bacterium]
VLVRAADGEVKLVDFGLARRDRKEFADLTQQGEILGTPAFMAPEQVDGAGKMSFATDVWALGILLFNLTTGKLPYPQGQGTLATLQAILTREAPLPSSIVPGLPRTVDEIFTRCCAHEPEERYPSALALATDLDALAKIEALKDDGPARARSRALIKRTLVYASFGVGAASILALLLALLLAPSKVSQEEDPTTEANRRRLGEDWKRTEERALDAAKRLDPVSFELEDSRLRDPAAALAKVASDLSRLKHEMHRACLAPPERAELDALSELATEVMSVPAHGSEAWERARSLDAFRADPRVAVLGVKLAIAAEDAPRALSRLKHLPPSAASLAMPLEAQAHLVAARKTKTKAERVEEIGAALAAHLPPRAVPNTMRLDVESAADELKQKILDAIADLAHGAGLSQTEVPALRARLEPLAAALEVWDKGSFSRELALTIAAAAEKDPGVLALRREEAGQPEARNLVDRGDRLLAEGRFQEALERYRAAQGMTPYDALAHQRALKQELVALVAWGKHDEAEALRRRMWDERALTPSFILGVTAQVVGYWEYRGTVEEPDKTERRLGLRKLIDEYIDHYLATGNSEFTCSSLRGEAYATRGVIRAMLADEDPKLSPLALADFTIALEDPRTRFHEKAIALRRGRALAFVLGSADETVKRFERAAAYVDAGASR